jgi:hypothetical protein
MLKNKQKYFTRGMLLLVGMGYFSVMSGLDINYVAKSLISIIPVQLLSVIYITYFRWKRS